MRRVLCAALLTGGIATAAPSRPPSAPTISPGARTFIAFGGAPAAVRLVWSAAANIARYRARWIEAGKPVDIELPGSATGFERDAATPGMHQLSVVAIDADGRESAPAEIAIEIVTVNAYAPGTSEPAAPGTTAFAVGARFASPGLGCQLGDGPRADEVVAAAPGATTLHCGGKPGEPRVDVPLVIAPILVDAPTAPLVRERPTRLHVTIASVAPIGDALDVEPIGDVDLSALERVPGAIEVSATPGTHAARVGLVVRAAGGELGRIELDTVDARAPALAVDDRPAWGAFDVGGQVGLFVPPTIGQSANALGHPSRPEDVLGTAPLVGVRGGWFPTRHAGLEAELSLGMPGYESTEGVATLVVGRVQLAARAIEDTHYGLRFLAGVDVLGVLGGEGTSQTDAAGGVHFGAAFTIETRRDLWLRIEALDVVTPARDAGYAHCAELQVGVVTRLGRRDRW